MRETHKMRETDRNTTRALWRPIVSVQWAAWAMVLWLPLAGAACSGSGTSSGEGGNQLGAAEDEEYPNLSRVPGEQPRPTPEDLRKDLVEGLTADRSNARYTNEPLTATSAAVPPASPPPAAQPQVEILWDTLRVLPEGEDAAEPEAVEDEASDSGQSDPASEESSEEVQINWDTERVEPSGIVTAAGDASGGESLILAPGPELVAVVYFDHDSDKVGQGDREMLEKVIALYKERGGRLRLVGHASSQVSTEDEVAQRMVNLDLSLKRANAVASTLVDLGAEQDKLLVEAKADSEPADSKLLTGAETIDRRVEIFLEH